MLAAVAFWIIGGLAAGTLSGCGGMGQSDHGTRTTVWAIGIPGVAILHNTKVSPVNTDTSENKAVQVNTTDIAPKFKEAIAKTPNISHAKFAKYAKFRF